MCQRALSYETVICFIVKFLVCAPERLSGARFLCYNEASERGRGRVEAQGRIFNIQKFSINDGPGIRTTVFFKGCPLRCRWCANPESQNRNARIADAMENELYRGRTCTVAEVMAVVRQDVPFYEESGGGLTLSGGEVLQQMDFAAALIEAARAEGIHTAVETTGFADPQAFRRFLPLPDLYLYDFKHYDRELHRAGTGVDNDWILENLRAVAAAGKPVVARIPVIPRFNLGMDHARGLASALRDIGVREVHLLPFHQFGEKKYEELGLEYEYRGVRQLHEEMLERYRQPFLDAGLTCSFR